MSHSEQKFQVAIPEDSLELLRKKLELTRLPDELDDSGWEYGSPLADVRRLVERWRNGYNWRAAEAKMNLLPQFTRDIDVDGHGTLNIHYVHKKSEAKDAIPLFFAHGCEYSHKDLAGNVDTEMTAGPGHFMEASKLIPLLTSTSGDKPSFHVVVYSLPGFGFSEAPKTKGFAISQYAEVCPDIHE